MVWILTYHHDTTMIVKTIWHFEPDAFLLLRVTVQLPDLLPVLVLQALAKNMENLSRFHLVYLCRKDPYCSRKAKPFLRSRASSTSLKWGRYRWRRKDCKNCNLGGHIDSHSFQQPLAKFRKIKICRLLTRGI